MTNVPSRRWIIFFYLYYYKSYLQCSYSELQLLLGQGLCMQLVLCHLSLRHCVSSVSLLVVSEDVFNKTIPHAAVTLLGANRLAGGIRKWTAAPPAEPNPAERGEDGAVLQWSDVCWSYPGDEFPSFISSSSHTLRFLGPYSELPVWQFLLRINYCIVWGVDLLLSLDNDMSSSVSGSRFWTLMWTSSFCPLCVSTCFIKTAPFSWACSFVLAVPLWSAAWSPPKDGCLSFFFLQENPA